MVPADNERRTGGSSEHVLNYRPDPEPIGAVAVGGTQHDQIRLSGASVQQNDPSCFSVLDINSDVHSSSLRRSPQVQQIGDSFRGSSIKGLAPWNGVDNDQLCGVDACQSEGLLKRSQSRLSNVHRAEHARDSFHGFVLRC
jgi:hypothetical protein